MCCASLFVEICAKRDVIRDGIDDTQLSFYVYLYFAIIHSLKINFISERSVDLKTTSLR